jgi:hypothetical protein
VKEIGRGLFKDSELVSYWKVWEKPQNTSFKKFISRPRFKLGTGCPDWGFRDFTQSIQATASFRILSNSSYHSELLSLKQSWSDIQKSNYNSATHFVLSFYGLQILITLNFLKFLNVAYFKALFRHSLERSRKTPWKYLISIVCTLSEIRPEFSRMTSTFTFCWIMETNSEFYNSLYLYRLIEVTLRSICV